MVMLLSAENAISRNDAGKAALTSQVFKEMVQEVIVKVAGPVVRRPPPRPPLF
jgi:hypothetical protein